MRVQLNNDFPLSISVGASWLDANCPWKYCPRHVFVCCIAMSCAFSKAPSLYFSSHKADSCWCKLSVAICLHRCFTVPTLLPSLLGGIYGPVKDASHYFSNSSGLSPSAGDNANFNLVDVVAFGNACIDILLPSAIVPSARNLQV